MALPHFRNVWLDGIEPNEHPEYTHEVGSNVLSAVLTDPQTAEPALARFPALIIR